MYAYNVLLTNTCNMYEIKILLLLLLMQHTILVKCTMRITALIMSRQYHYIYDIGLITRKKMYRVQNIFLHRNQLELMTSYVRLHCASHGGLASLIRKDYPT